MEQLYRSKLEDVYAQIGDHAKIVLATSNQDKVSARMLSFIIEDGLFYFQTDSHLRKYNDLKHNHNVALCTNNIQIEGTCIELGHPLEHIKFIEKFKTYFPSSFNSYSSLDSERLFVIKPTFIQRWSYHDQQPIIEQYFIERLCYHEIEYK